MKITRPFIQFLVQLFVMAHCYCETRLNHHNPLYIFAHTHFPRYQ
jgi:hypothetical protein